MTVFAILSDAGNERAKGKILELFPAAFQIAPGQHAVSATGLTASQIAAQIGANGELGRFVVFAISSYWGYHNKELWEWLKVNSE
jgi:hypothetical protein